MFKELPNLEDLLFVGNPLYDGCELEVWRSEAARRLPGLKKLDGETVLREDEPPLTVADIEVIFILNNITSRFTLIFLEYFLWVENLLVLVILFSLKFILHN